MTNSSIDTKNIPAVAILAAAGYFCIHFSLFSGYSIGLFFGSLPLALICCFYCIYNPHTAIIFLFILNYFIMGIGRYMSLPIPVTNIYDLVFALIFTSILLRQLYQENKYLNVLNLYTLFALLWLSYCTINLGNNITGEIQFEPWLRTIRPLAVYSLSTCIIISIIAKKYTFIQQFLLFWGILTLLGAAKGYWQKSHGIDHAEFVWLMTVGAKTHIISTGIRYFSFFTDAACFGCTMGLSSVVFFLSSFYTREKYLRIFYLVVSMGAFYGLLISGTRAAIAVPIAGLGLFIFLAKNWKISIAAAVILIVGVAFLKFTNIGQGNPLIRRMRSAFDTEDASFQVRLNNQKALKAYMSEIPFGIGIGVKGGDVTPMNKYYFVATCPPDSDLVNIWIRTGQVGLTVYLVIQFFVFLCGTYTLLFRIRNPEIRGPLTGMLCGCAGIQVASYANMVFFQFPNGPIIYTCFTLVFLGPYFDKQYSAEHGITT